MIKWVLVEANVSVAPEHEARLIAAYHRLIAQPLPEGLLQTELLRGQDGRWRIQTLWQDRFAMEILRAWPDDTAAVHLFRDLGGAEPEFQIFEVVDEWITAEPEGLDPENHASEQHASEDHGSEQPG